MRTVADGLQANRWARDIQGTIGIQEIGEYLQLWHMIEQTTLSAKQNRLIWKWSSPESVGHRLVSGSSTGLNLPRNPHS